MGGALKFTFAIYLDDDGEMADRIESNYQSNLARWKGK
jgi:hypothetical protein